MKNPLPNLSTKKLLSILHTELSGMEFVGGAFKDVNELVLATHDELDRRFAERGEYVRLSNKTKGLCGPAYVCAKALDNIAISTYYEYDAVKAKSYRRVK